MTLCPTYIAADALPLELPHPIDEHLIGDLRKRRAPPSKWQAARSGWWFAGQWRRSGARRSSCCRPAGQPYTTSCSIRRDGIVPRVSAVVSFWSAYEPPHFEPINPLRGRHVDRRRAAFASTGCGRTVLVTGGLRRQQSCRGQNGPSGECPSPKNSPSRSLVIVS